MEKQACRDQLDHKGQRLVSILWYRLAVLEFFEYLFGFTFSLNRKVKVIRILLNIVLRS